MRRLKAMWFSDKRLAYLALKSANLAGNERGVARGSGLIHDAVKAMTGGVTETEVRSARHKLGVRPVFKRIDTCAAEFEARTPRSEEHTSELQSLMRISYAVFCLKKKKHDNKTSNHESQKQK